MIQTTDNQVDEFDVYIELLRSGDPETYENGFFGLVGCAAEYTDRLIPLMLTEPDPNMRAKFIELLGETKSPNVVPLLTTELDHKEREVRYWAVLALDIVGTTQAKALAEKHRLANPAEWSDWTASIAMEAGRHSA